MSPAHSRTILLLIVNPLFLVVMNSLSLSPGTSTMHLPAREASGGRATGKKNVPYYGDSRGSSRGSSRKSQEMIAKSSSNPHVMPSEQTKVETTSQRQLSSPALNVSVARGAEGESRGVAHYSKKSQSLIAVAGVPYYPVAVGVRRIVPVQVPTIVSNAGGGAVGFVPGDDSGVVGSGHPNADDGIDAGFVPTYRCGTAKVANCQG
ncbi:hypothetical protein MRX96_023452 [Rhipicephalus microplus]